MRGETAICDCDLRSVMRGELRRVGDDDGRAPTMTTMGELRRPRSEYWGFGLVLPFWYKGSVLGGFFFFFFYKHSILLLVCFAFAL